MRCVRAREVEFFIEKAKTECLVQGRAIVGVKRVHQDKQKKDFFHIRIYELHFGSASTGDD
jgi:hypothetical protein